MSSSSLRRLAAPVLFVVLLAACGSSGGGSSSDAGGSGGTTGSTTTASTVPPGKLFADDFTAVCQGATQSRAATYEQGGSHKMVYIQTFEDHLQDDSQVLPTDWAVQFDANTDAYAKTDVVGCGVRTGGTFIKECTGYQDKGKDTGVKVELYSGVYEVSVHEARTGKELAKTTLKSTDTDCPMFQSFDQGDKEVKVYQDPVKDQLIAFLKPYAQS